MSLLLFANNIKCIIDFLSKNDSVRRTELLFSLPYMIIIVINSPKIIRLGGVVQKNYAITTNNSFYYTLITNHTYKIEKSLE